MLSRSEVRNLGRKNQEEAEKIAKEILDALNKRVELLEKNPKIMRDSPVQSNQYLIMLSLMFLMTNSLQVRGDVGWLRDKRLEDEDSQAV